MAYDFSNEITNFQKYGTYNYIADEGGNFVFNKTSIKFENHYIAIPLTNLAYNNQKVNSFYDTEFKEFTSIETTPVTPVISTEVAALTQENEDLKNKLNSVVQNSSTSISESETLAIKQIIIELRTKLGEGASDIDFLNEFPYFPLKSSVDIIT